MIRPTLLTTALLLAACTPTPTTPAPDGGDATPAWLSDSRVLVPGVGVTNDDCRSGICRHNENTDLFAWKGAIWFVHRTAKSQVLGPNSSLRIHKSTDGGARFDLVTVIPAPAPMNGDGGRDLRDPHFFTVGDTLFIKALTRLPVVSARDSDVDTIAVETHSDDGGKTWTPIAPIAPKTWSLWRPIAHDGTLYSAAYEDGDKSVVLFTSKDGRTWTRGPLVWGDPADTPVETELTFMPSGRLLALVRMDGTDPELLGDVTRRLRTKVCWAQPPAYDKFDCPQDLMGQRLDGPLSFWWKNRLFHIARKHLPDFKKRTALFEIGGNLEGGPLTIKEWGELPSAGDTAYAGCAPIDDHRFTVTWYSGDIVDDQSWIFAMLDPTDIRQATIDLAKLP